jgi:hypothetical protein
MKPYRVKRAGRLIGSFLVVHEGRRVNLDTKDASEARRRALLVEKGEWPPRGNDLAGQIHDTLEGKGPPIEPAPMPTEPLPPVAPPAQASVPIAPPDPVASPAAVLNDVAAEEAANLENEAKSTLAKAGFDLGEVEAKAPELLAGAHLWMQGQLCRLGVRVVKGRWPTGVVTLSDGDPMRKMLGKLWLAKLREWDLDLSKVGPGWWLVILSAVTGLAQVGGMIAAMEEEDKAAAAAAKVN